MLTGKLFAKKLGMTSLYDANNALIALTVLEVIDCTVLRLKSGETDGYSSIVVGYGACKMQKVKKPHSGLFKKIGTEPLKSIAEFRLYNGSLQDKVKEGSVLSLKDFNLVQNQLVDVSAISKGKGFAGVIKRYHFGGLEASHGVSASHRSGGSTGGCQDPGRVFKNKKMPGQLGAKMITSQNLQVFSLDFERGIILLKGSVPGPKNVIVSVRDAIKEQLIQRGRKND